MGTDTSTASGALKQIYGEYDAQQNLRARAIDEISKSLKKYNNGGQGYYGAINDFGNESVGAITENEAFRTVDNEDYVQYKVVPKILVGPIEFSGLVSEAADSDDEAFANLVLDALDKAKDRLLSDENRQFYGFGTGQLAKVNANVAASATSFTVDSTQYLRENMVVDIYHSATLTWGAQRISIVDRVNNVVTMTAAGANAAIVTNDVIVKQNIKVSAPSDGKEMMGLRGIVDDSTDLTTFENINCVLNAVWRSRVIAASSANLTSDLLQRLIDDVAILSDEEPDKLIMHRRQRRKYLDIVVPQKRYMDEKLDTGFTKVEFNGKELWLDKDCQTDTVYAINLKHIKKFELAAMTMGKHEGSDTFLRKLNYDGFQAYWRHYCNFGTGRRNAHGKITGLAVPSGVS